MNYRISSIKYRMELLVTIFICFIFVSQIKAATINVYNTGKIGDAISIANDGDRIFVYPGTYTGEGNVNLSFGGKNIEVIGVYGSSQTIIDCGGAPNRAFNLIDGETSESKIIGFTFKNGNITSRYVNGYLDDDGGLIFTSSSPEIIDCVFEGGIRNLSIKMRHIS